MIFLDSLSIYISNKSILQEEINLDNVEITAFKNADKTKIDILIVQDKYILHVFYNESDISKYFLLNIIVLNVLIFRFKIKYKIFKQKVIINFMNLLKKIVKSIIKSPYKKKKIRRWINLMKIIERYRFNKRIKKLSSSRIFDINNLTQDLELYSTELYPTNNFYGIANNLKKYSGYNEPINACIEHGVYFGGFVNDSETINSGLSAIITFGSKRYEHIKKVTDKRVIKIGPYIHYADQYYSEEEIKNIKRKLGANLLVFPTHSIDNVNVNYNIQKFIFEIKKIGKKFDTINICLYWKDIQRGLHNAYKDEGFNIVTAGHRNDPNFLNRLKTIITLSDYTISNDIGTHIGYCIYLNKPHYVFNQKTNYSGKTKADYKKEFDRGKNYTRIFDKEKNEIVNSFNEFKFNITSLQKEVCNKYWGFEELKTPNELNNIFNNLK